MTGELGGIVLADPLALDVAPGRFSDAVDAAQQRCDDLRACSEIWMPEPAPPTTRPTSDAERMAVAVEAIRVERERSRRRIVELDRQRAALVRLRIALGPVKEQHYSLQQMCPSADLDGWFVLADTADDLIELEGGRCTEAETRFVLREVTRRLHALERRLTTPPRTDRLLCMRSTRPTVKVEPRKLADDRHTLADPSTVERWPSEADAGPASLVTRQPVLSNAPPSGDGPAHHLLAAT